MTDTKTRRLLRELSQIKERLRVHAFDVVYNPRRARKLSEHIVDIKRCDEIETLLARKGITSETAAMCKVFAR